jgi:hypothetical protein
MGYVPYVSFATYRRATMKIRLYFKRLMFMQMFCKKKGGGGGRHSLTCYKYQRNMCFWHEKWSDWSSSTSLHFCQFCRVCSSPLGLNVSAAHLGAQMSVVLEPICLKGSFATHCSGLRVVEGHMRSSPTEPSLSPFPKNPNFQFASKPPFFT